MAPRTDERFSGVPHRYAAYGFDDPAYPIAHNVAELGVNHNSVGLWDHLTLKLITWHAGERSSVGEPIFVARTPDAAEGDGSVLVVVQRLSERRSELIILNAIHNAWLDRVPAELRG